MGLFTVQGALLTFVILKIAFSSSEELCQKINVCSCKLTNGSVVSLHAVDGTATQPSFSDLKSVDSDRTFDWNPCTPFKVAQCEQDHVLVAQLGAGPECFPAGTDDTSFSVDTTGSVVIAYGNITSGSGPTEAKRSTKVTLQCDPEGSGKGTWSPFEETQPEKGTSIYSANFTSKYACATGGDSFYILL